MVKCLQSKTVENSRKTEEGERKGRMQRKYHPRVFLLKCECARDGGLFLQSER